MIFDKFGTIERGVFTFYPGILRSARFYGFDENDPVYRRRIPYERGRTNCPVCGIHDDRERRLPCDVMLARAADMEAAGYPATFCGSCSRAMPVRGGQSKWGAKCWSCESLKRDRPEVRDGAVRVSDGLGCTERLPSWMIDYDGNLEAGSR